MPGWLILSQIQRTRTSRSAGTPPGPCWIEMGNQRRASQLLLEAMSNNPIRILHPQEDRRTHYTGDGMFPYDEYESTHTHCICVVSDGSMQGLKHRQHQRSTATEAIRRQKSGVPHTVRVKERIVFVQGLLEGSRTTEDEKHVSKPMKPNQSNIINPLIRLPNFNTSQSIMNNHERIKWPGYSTQYRNTYVYSHGHIIQHSKHINVIHLQLENEGDFAIA